MIAVSLSSVVDKLQGPTVGLAAAVVLLASLAALLYLQRGRALLWLFGRGAATAERVIRQILSVAGVDDPQWVLVCYPSPAHWRLGLVTARLNGKASVYIPASPQLAAGELVFVDEKHIREIPGLDFDEGLEVLLSLGYAPERPEAVAKILARLG